MTEEQKRQAMAFTQPTPVRQPTKMDNLIGMGGIDPFSGNKDLVKLEAPDIQLEGLGDKIDKGLGLIDAKGEKVQAPLSSKESSKTVSKAENKVQRADTPKAAPSERTEYVTDPKKMDTMVTETKTELDKAVKDEDTWMDSLGKLGIDADTGKKVWGELTSTADRFDWLTTLTVYAASRYMGNNSGLALANGLMRGMESKAKQDQVLAAQKSGAAKAAQDQANKEREMSTEEFRANTGRINANTGLLNSQNKGVKAIGQLSADDDRIISALSESKGYDKAAAQEAANQIKQAGGIVSAGALDNQIQQNIANGTMKNPWGTTAASLL